MKTTRSATSWANRTSWVTTIIVMPASRKAPHHRQNFADQLWIERGGRLVEQHEARRDGQRAGDGNALLLAAREPVRQLVAHDD